MGYNDILYAFPISTHFSFDKYVAEMRGILEVSQ